VILYCPESLDLTSIAALVTFSGNNIEMYSTERARTPACCLVGIRMEILGIRLRTWTRVVVNRCIGKIIARDLCLVASRLYRMAVTRPPSHVAVTLSLSLGADLLG